MPLPVQTAATPTVGSSQPDEGTSWREIDWRFVMPPPPDGGFHDVLLPGGDTRQSRLILDSGWARQIRREVPSAAPVDALVLRAGCDADVMRLAGAVRDGGVLYAEIDRRTRRDRWQTPARLRRALRRSNFDVTGIYWAVGGFSRPRLYLPLTDHAALQWYVRNLFTATNPRKRLLGAALRVVMCAGVQKLLPVVPRFVVTATRGAAPGVPTRRLDLPDLSRLPGGATTRLVLLGGDNDLNRVAILPFVRGSRQPPAVLKVGRVADPVNARIEIEQRVLHQLSQTGEHARSSVPAPLGTAAWGGLTVGIEECAAGRLLSASLERWGAARTAKLDALKAVMTWAIDFHASTPAGPQTWSRHSVGEWIEAPLARYVHVAGDGPVQRRLFALTRDRSRALVGARLPVVWLHWGLTNRNIYRAGRRTTVVDWEGGSPGPSLLDILFFLANWYYAATRCHSGSGRVRGLEHLYVDHTEHDWAVVAARRSLGRYLEALRIDSRFVPPMLVVMSAMRALGQWRLLRENGSGPYTAHVLALGHRADEFFDLWTC
jgi:hypothetical protein